jgi:MoxR-like ATPase
MMMFAEYPLTIVSQSLLQANSAILNTLLTLVNERLFDNGSQRVPVPLITVIGASNELPESEELDALYDRFLIRKLVKQVSSAGR